MPSRGQIEITAVLFWIRDECQGPNLESMTYKYVRTDLNSIAKIFSPKK